MQHPAQSTDRPDPESHVTVRATGTFVVRELDPAGGNRARHTVPGESVRVPLWAVDDLKIRGLAA